MVTSIIKCILALEFVQYCNLLAFSLNLSQNSLFHLKIHDFLLQCSHLSNKIMFSLSFTTVTSVFQVIGCARRLSEAINYVRAMGTKKMKVVVDFFAFINNKYFLPAFFYVFRSYFSFSVAFFCESSYFAAFP